MWVLTDSIFVFHGLLDLEKCLGQDPDFLQAVGGQLLGGERGGWLVVILVTLGTPKP